MTLPEFSPITPVELPMEARLRMFDEVQFTAEAQPAPDYYRQFVPLARILLSAQYHMIVEGLENIPDRRSIFVINHIKAADSVIASAVVSAHTGVPLRMAAKQEYFEGRGIDGKGKYGKSIQWFMNNTGQVEVDRDLANPRSAIRLGEKVNEIVNERGEHFGIHAEGTRSLNGKVNRMFNSIGRWSLDHSIPLVPVGLHYFPPSGLLKREPTTIRIGEPLLPESYLDEDNIVFQTKGLSRKAQVVTDIIEERVALLAGLERSGEFAFDRESRNEAIK